MSKNIVKSTVLGILSVHALVGNVANAENSENTDKRYEERISTTSANIANRIIQKKLLGFDPKQAVNTLTYLKESGVESFQTDGSIIVSNSIMDELLTEAMQDGLEVRILKIHSDTVKLKFAAYSEAQFDISQAEKVKSLATYYKLKCDMDGK